MWRLASLSSSAYPSSQPEGKFVLLIIFRLSRICGDMFPCYCFKFCLFVCLQMAEYFQPTHLELDSQILEQVFSHHDHNTHCSLFR